MNSDHCNVWIQRVDERLHELGAALCRIPGDGVGPIARRPDSRHEDDYLLHFALLLSWSLLRQGRDREGVLVRDGLVPPPHEGRQKGKEDSVKAQIVVVNSVYGSARVFLLRGCHISGLPAAPAGIQARAGVERQVLDSAAASRRCRRGCGGRPRGPRRGRLPVALHGSVVQPTQTGHIPSSHAEGGELGGGHSTGTMAAAPPALSLRFGLALAIDFVSRGH
mmetsp:Transcript_12370/g.36336  ORF Transcript_12370/g.36336 Transcript_12370/m.36336 type:complete len:222 (-) Transcript_12370:1936-2601(-)